MAKRQVLFIGNDGLQHYLCKSRYATLVGEYGWDQADLVKNLAAGLHKTGVNTPVILLSDQTEQQYRKDMLPKASILDRGKMLERKLNMAFAQMPYRASLPIKSAKKEIGDVPVPNVLFAGLPQTSELMKVIQAVTESEVILDSIALVPTEAVPMINRMIKILHERTQVIDRPRWTILLTQHKTGGLRQIVLQDGELALTRLTPIFVNSDQELGQIRDVILKEFQATLNYLSRFGYVAADGIDVITITSEIMGEGLQQASLPVTHLYTLSVAEATRLLKTGIKNGADTLYSDGLLAAVTAGHKIILPLKNAAIKPLQQGRKAVMMGGMVLALSMMALVGGLGWIQTQTTMLHKQTETSQNDKRVMQLRYNDLAQMTNTLKYKPETVQAVLNVRDELVKTNLNTEPTVQAIEKMIDKGTLILQSITLEPAKMDAQEIGGPPPAPPLDTTSEAYPPRITVTLELKYVNSGDVENNARLTEQLLSQLKAKFNQHDVRVTKMVGNLSVSDTVRGMTEQASNLQVEVPEAQRNEVSEIQITGAAL